MRVTLASNRLIASAKRYLDCEHGEEQAVVHLPRRHETDQWDDWLRHREEQVELHRRRGRRARAGRRPAREQLPHRRHSQHALLLRGIVIRACRCGEATVQQRFARLLLCRL
eukprot:2014105-Pleurochrysis_carterae.AAC.2